MTPAQRARARRSRNDLSLREFILAITCALLTTWVAINWITGCGTFESTLDGRILYGECVLVPWSHN